MRTCPLCNSVQPKPERWDFEQKNLETSSFLDHRSAMIGDKTFGFMFFLDGTTPHLTASLCISPSTSEVVAEIHEWMDTFQMNPKAICADVAFHHPHGMQAFYRMHNVKRTPTGPHTPWPNRAEMDVRLFKKSLSNDEKYTSDLKWRHAHGVGHGTKNKRSLDPASMNREQLTSTPTKQDLLNEEI